MINCAATFILENIENVVPLSETIQKCARWDGSRSSAGYAGYSTHCEATRHNQRQEFGNELHPS